MTMVNLICLKAISRQMIDMNRMVLYLTGILILAQVAAMAVSAQDSSAGLNNTASNNTTLNNTAINETAPAATPSNSSAVLLGNADAAGTARNLSTVNDRQISALPISQMAEVAPEVAAGASSAQVGGEENSSYKIGDTVGGIDPFNPEHVDVEPVKVGLENKSMVDTGKLFFVCDIV